MPINISNVVKRYKDLVALDHFSLTAEKGEILGLLGPNGAGKSTAIKAMCNLISIDKGEVFLFDEKMRGQCISQKKRLGLVPQELAIYENLSAKANLKYFGRIYGLKGEQLSNRADEVLEMLGLTQVANKTSKHFSGGMKRRLNLGCAIMHSPKLLILDEPTVGVDPQSRNHILDFVVKMAEKGVTIVYTSHYMEEVEKICSRVVIMDSGRVIANGTTEEITRSLMFEEKMTLEIKNISPSLAQKLREVQGVVSVDVNGRTVEISSTSGAGNVARLVEICSAYGVVGITSNAPSLEDAFLSLTGKKLRDGDTA